MRAGDLFPLSNEYPGLAWINACACACSVYVVLTAGEGALPCMAAQERQSQIRIDAHARTHARTLTLMFILFHSPSYFPILTLSTRMAREFSPGVHRSLQACLAVASFP